MTHRTAPRIATRLRSARGATLIEAAIMTPLLLTLTFGVIDFAAMFYVYLALESGVSQATRFGITGNLMDDPDNPGNPLSRESSIRAAMRGATPSLTLEDDAFQFQHRAQSGSSWTGGTGGPDDLERVTVRYTYSPLTPILRPLLPGGVMTFEVQSTMKNEGRFE
jgi:hypothetical protein